MLQFTSRWIRHANLTTYGDQTDILGQHSDRATIVFSPANSLYEARSRDCEGSEGSPYNRREASSHCKNRCLRTNLDIRGSIKSRVTNLVSPNSDYFLPFHVLYRL